MDVNLITELSIRTSSKIVLLVIDGLGGMPDNETKKSELEMAFIPNLHKLAEISICGLIDPISPGITPGSGPGHLALFGYDPLKYTIGRGILEALGVDFNLQPEDIAARGNFCTVNSDGLVTDRRAGRLSSKEAIHICHEISGIELLKTSFFVLPVAEHRFVLIIRGNGLDQNIADTDPQKTGLKPIPAIALNKKATETASLVNKFVEIVKDRLKNTQPANMILLRGFSKLPKLPSMEDCYHLRSAAIVDYPMYKGVSKLVGMKVLTTGGKAFNLIETLKNNYENYDFFFLHIKKTDSAGEDGDFAGKIKRLEEVDSVIPELINVNPDVLVVTGDHSTPARLKGHSWHPVPVLISSSYCRPDEVKLFTENACISGGLGRIKATQLLTLAMANALKLSKYGA